MDYYQIFLTDVINTLNSVCIMKGLPPINEDTSKHVFDTLFPLIEAEWKKPTRVFDCIFEDTYFTSDFLLLVSDLYVPIKEDIFRQLYMFVCKYDDHKELETSGKISERCGCGNKPICINRKCSFVSYPWEVIQPIYLN